MSRIHFDKRRDFLKGAACFAASGAASTFVPQLSLMGTALAQGATGYRALVCINLDGGNDAWNLLIPADNSTQIPVAGRTPLAGQQPTPYGWYVASRGGQFAGNASALGLLPPGSTRPSAAFLPPAIGLNGGQYGVNPACQGIADLYNQGRLSFVANVGPLVEPLRRQTFSSFKRPPQLYSHSDQTSLWQIGGGASVSDPNGWGGRVAGQVLGVNPASGLSPCISITGQTRFLVGQYPGGQTLFPYRLSTSATVPATSLGSYNATDPAGAKRREVLNALLAETYPQAFSREYGDIVARSLNLSVSLNAAITSLAANPAFAAFNTAVNNIPNSGIGQQLRQVARMIAVSRFGAPGFSIQANRQIFFVRTGGYDTHDGQIPAVPPDPVPTNYVYTGHQGLLQQVSQAMAGFNAALTALDAVTGYAGVLNEVLTFTQSEFARTINSNGNGTDHAWGSVSMIMGAPQSAGGPLAGGQVFGRYPLQLLNRQFGATPDALGECFSRGEFLPSLAVDQYAGTLARWMGVSSTDLPTVFPNINTFASAHPNEAVMAYNSRIVPGMLAGVT